MTSPRRLLGLAALVMAALVTTAGGCTPATTTTSHGGRAKTLVIPDGSTEITTDMAGNWKPKRHKGCSWSIVVRSGKKHVTMASGHGTIGDHAVIFPAYRGGIFHSSGCGGWR